MTIDIAVVPVAGHGTRLLPATKSQPKEMLPVGRKPVVQYVIEELVQAGIQRVLFVTGARKTAIENHFDEDIELNNFLRKTGKEDLLAELEFERQNVEFFYTRQRRQLGLGHAVLCARSLVGSQPFAVALGDSIIGIGAKSDIVARMLELYESQHADIVVAFEEVAPSEVFRYGIAMPRGPVGDVFELQDVVEKPEPDEAPSNLAVAARYVFSPTIFEHLSETPRGKGNEIQLTDAMSRMLVQGGKGIGLRLPPSEARYDIGNHQSYYRAFINFALADAKEGARLREYLETLLRK